MSTNKCDRCGRELVDPDDQFGWRCAKIVEESAHKLEFQRIELEYIERLIREAEEIGSVISQKTRTVINDLDDKLRKSIRTFFSEAEKGVTELGRAALNAILSTSIGLETPVNALTSGRNFEKNISLNFDDFIFDQNTGSAAKLKIGAFGNGADNGCGAVAVYNALALLGNSVHPAYIIRALEATGGAITGGLLGVNPEAVENVFRGLEYNIISEYLPVNLDYALKESHVGILAYAHEKGAHYVAVQYVDGKHHIYNEGYIKDNAHELDSINDWLKKGSLLPISLITIPLDIAQPKGSETYTGMI